MEIFLSMAFFSRALGNPIISGEGKNDVFGGNILSGDIPGIVPDGACTGCFQPAVEASRTRADLQIPEDNDRSIVAG